MTPSGNGVRFSHPLPRVDMLHVVILEDLLNLQQSIVFGQPFASTGCTV